MAVPEWQLSTPIKIGDLQGNSRIGATVSGDIIDARFEIGVNETNVTSRRLYGIWKFTENWGLKIGKDFTPILFGLSNQVFNNDLNLWQFGNAYAALSQLLCNRLSLNRPEYAGQFVVALMVPYRQFD